MVTQVILCIEILVASSASRTSAGFVSSMAAAVPPPEDGAEVAALPPALSAAGVSGGTLARTSCSSRSSSWFSMGPDDVYLTWQKEERMGGW